MSHRVLITGASGYLGGTLMARLAASRADLPPFETLFASVRNDAQAESVRSLYGAEPLSVDFRDARAVRDAVVGHRITVVFYLIDAIGTDGQLHLIRALAEVKKATGLPVHFLHTTGAKLFSSHAGAPTDRPLLDTDPDLYDIQRAQKARFPLAQKGVEANCKIIDAAEELGVRSYIFAPCIVYGKNEGFGNPVSIQTVAIVRAAKAAGRVYRVDEGRPVRTIPSCP
ncbi:hypothetical protein VTK73DRAFT_791 [Phialemonium thermophilum]|uniref:NAD-dependent epimerase/dehydratase domain-containing protein n=1 Tax=Phialemonium thermophilum TaxID=223376 RepID=A0ABR3VU98_9PEZI